MTTETAPAVEQTFLEKLRALNTDRLFVHVELDRLKIDPRYQRTVDKPRVRRMASKFDENLMGVLVCSVREDGVYVIDGQHRLELARLLELNTIRCELRIGLTLEQEANIFYNLDTARSGLSGDDAYRALLTAGDETALAVQKAIQKSGLRESFTGPIQGGVRAYKTLLKLTKTHGIEPVAQALHVLGTAWPESNRPAPANVLEGLSYFMTKYPDVDQKELARALRAHTDVDQLGTSARAISGSLSWNTKTSMGRAILAAYNHSRSTNRLEDRF